MSFTDMKRPGIVWRSVHSQDITCSMIQDTGCVRVNVPAP